MNTDFGSLKFDQQKEMMQDKLVAFFPDKDWFVEKVFLLRDPANRCSHFDLTSDWYYLDSDAEQHFTKAHGEEKYKKEVDILAKTSQ